MKFFQWKFILGRHPSIAIAAAALAVSLLGVQPPILAQRGESSEHWVGTWATGVVARPPAGFAEGDAPPGQASVPPLKLNNQTLRQIVHASIGGERLRVVLTNTFGTAPLTIGAAYIAVRENGATIRPASARRLTFGGNPASTIPAGAVAFSDPVNLTVPPLADLVIDMYLPRDMTGGISPLTMHPAAWQTNYVSRSGNYSGAVEIPLQTTTQSWFFLSRVEVMAPRAVGAIVAIGDSITDGNRSTPDANTRWPDYLATRLVTERIKMAVLNVGIGGNRLLDQANDQRGVSALARFDRDVLLQAGVTHVIVLEGINDLGRALGRARENPSLTASALIAGHRQLIERAHARGLKIYGATLTPSEGAGNWTLELEAERQKLNEWIRTSAAYDAVIDFDAAVRDPRNPTKFLPQFNSGDSLHPNAAGYQAMANAITFNLLDASQVLRQTAEQ